jgi:hypothetical protein
MALLHKMVACVFLCGSVAKKVTATMSSLSSMVVEKAMAEGIFFSFIYLFICGAFGLVRYN